MDLGRLLTVGPGDGETFPDLDATADATGVDRAFHPFLESLDR